MYFDWSCIFWETTRHFSLTFSLIIKNTCTIWCRLPVSRHQMFKTTSLPLHKQGVPSSWEQMKSHSVFDVVRRAFGRLLLDLSYVDDRCLPKIKLICFTNVSYHKLLIFYPPDLLHVLGVDCFFVFLPILGFPCCFSLISSTCKCGVVMFSVASVCLSACLSVMLQLWKALT